MCVLTEPFSINVTVASVIVVNLQAGFFYYYTILKTAWFQLINCPQLCNLLLYQISGGESLDMDFDVRGEELHVTVLSACPLLLTTLSAIYKQK